MTGRPPAPLSADILLVGSCMPGRSVDSHARPRACSWVVRLPSLAPQLFVCRPSQKAALVTASASPTATDAGIPKPPIRGAWNHTNLPIRLLSLQCFRCCCISLAVLLPGQNASRLRIAWVRYPRCQGRPPVDVGYPNPSMAAPSSGFLCQWKIPASRDLPPSRREAGSPGATAWPCLEDLLVGPLARGSSRRAPLPNPGLRFGGTEPKGCGLAFRVL